MVADLLESNFKNFTPFLIILFSFHITTTFIDLSKNNMIDRPIFIYFTWIQLILIYCKFISLLSTRVEKNKNQWEFVLQIV